ncbi:hypothetical protein C8J56DRAFT_943353 [Mycena floridula]|nr:hypothetical protein C8J56DRAFT_943353 [Mycena floridula]
MASSCSNCGFWSKFAGPTVEPDISPKMMGLLFSNEPPNESERAIFLQLLSEGKQDLSELDAQIAQACQLLKHLNERREDTQHMVNIYTGAVSAARLMPLELQSKILALCADVGMFDRDATTGIKSALEYYEDGHHHRISRRLPWSLSRISSTWRSAALLTPKLWSYISIIVYPDLESKPEIGSYRPSWGSTKALTYAVAQVREVQLLRYQLEHSRSHPLSISLFGPGMAYAYETSGWHPIIDELVTSSHRWEELCIKFRGFDKSMLMKTTSSLPALRRLHCRTDLGSTINFGNLPQLTSLVISMDPGTVYHWKPSLLLQLTELALWECTNDKSIDLSILGSTPMLQILSITGFPYFHHSYNTGPILLSHLYKFSLKHRGKPPPFRNALSQLTTPKLEILVLGSMANVDPSIKEMIEASKCSLRKLQLRSLNFGRDDLIQLLQLLPNLVDLDVNRVALDSGTVLSILAQRPDLLPVLRTVDAGRLRQKEEQDLEGLKGARLGLQIHSLPRAPRWNSDPDSD